MSSVSIADTKRANGQWQIEAVLSELHGRGSRGTAAAARINTLGDVHRFHLECIDHIDRAIAAINSTLDMVYKHRLIDGHLYEPAVQLCGCLTSLLEERVQRVLALLGWPSGHVRWSHGGNGPGHAYIELGNRDANEFLRRALYPSAPEGTPYRVDSDEPRPTRAEIEAIIAGPTEAPDPSAADGAERIMATNELASQTPPVFTPPKPKREEFIVGQLEKLDDALAHQLPLIAEFDAETHGATVACACVHGLLEMKLKFMLELIGVPKEKIQTYAEHGGVKCIGEEFGFAVLNKEIALLLNQWFGLRYQTEHDDAEYPEYKFYATIHISGRQSLPLCKDIVDALHKRRQAHRGSPAIAD